MGGTSAAYSHSRTIISVTASRTCVCTQRGTRKTARPRPTSKAMFSCVTRPRREISELRELLQASNAENNQLRVALEQKCLELEEASASHAQERTALCGRLHEEQAAKQGVQQQLEASQSSLAQLQGEHTALGDKAKKAQHQADKYKAHAKKLHGDLHRTKRENEDLESRLDRMQQALEMLEGVLDEVASDGALRQSKAYKGGDRLRQSRADVANMIRESRVRLHSRRRMRC